MYDATSPPSIPDTVPEPDYAAGYLDGKWPSFAAMVARFPNANHVSITAIPGSPQASSAQVCDCEDGDYTASQAAAWAAGRLAMRVVPTIYCSASNWGNVQLACVALGVSVSSVDWWIAAYPGPGPVLYGGSVAHQYADCGTYDESIVLDGWVPGRSTDPPPQPPPPPEDNVAVSQAVQYRPGQVDIFQVFGGWLWHKFQVNGGAWQNEAVVGPGGGSSGVTATLAEVQPGVSVLDGNSVWVSVELNTGYVMAFAQGPTGNWGAAALP